MVLVLEKFEEAQILSTVLVESRSHSAIGKFEKLGLLRIFILHIYRR
jgi:hypothetical protein